MDRFEDGAELLVPAVVEEFVKPVDRRPLEFLVFDELLQPFDLRGRGGPAAVQTFLLRKPPLIVLYVPSFSWISRSSAGHRFIDVRQAGLKRGLFVAEFRFVQLPLGRFERLLRARTR